jgi:hypothetical protein
MPHQQIIIISEEEKIKRRLALSYSQRFKAAMQMIRLKQKLQSATIIKPNDVMDILDEDIIAFRRELANNKVKYIMIGGFASILHGSSRITQDVDIWIEDTLENRKNLRKTIANLNLGDFKEIETIQFVPGWTSIYLTHGIELDVLTSLKAFPQSKFIDCLNMAYVADIRCVLLYLFYISTN